jgi:hypothetical protein
MRYCICKLQYTQPAGNQTKNKSAKRQVVQQDGIFFRNNKSKAMAGLAPG